MNNLKIIDQDETFNFQINENVGALDGNTIGSGTEEPSLGRDGDLYLKTTNGDVYKKINGVWTVIGNLIGPRGNPFVFEDFTIEQIEELMLPAVNGKQIAINAAETANEATYGANAARDEALSAASGANTARDEANTARDEASTATSRANAAIDEALDAAEIADIATNNANIATGLANTATNNANTARDNANTATSQANTARDSANTAATAANTAKTNADTAATNANNKATLAENASILANEKATQAQTATQNAITAIIEIQEATENAVSATNNAVAATNNANTATTNAIAAATLAENAKGWTPIFIDINDGARIVRKLNDYVSGTGTKPTVNMGKYLKSDGTYTAVISEAIDYKGSTTAGVTTGVVISFANDRFYGSVATPETGNITANTTDAQLGITNVIIHNSATAPTFSSQFKKLSGSGNYLVNNVNYIFCTYVTATEIIYIISQRI